MAGLDSFEYAPDKGMDGLKDGDILLCEIDAKHLTTENVGIKERRVWGTDTYTDESDLVAIAAHAGVFSPTADVPKFAGMVMVVRGSVARHLEVPRFMERVCKCAPALFTAHHFFVGQQAFV